MEDVMCLNHVKNQDIRQILNLVRREGIYNYLIAEEMGISEITFSRNLRREMCPEKKQKIKNAVEKIKNEWSDLKNGN